MTESEMPTVSLLLKRDRRLYAKCPVCGRETVATRPSGGFSVLRAHGTCDVMPVAVSKIYRHRIGEYLLAMKQTQFNNVTRLKAKLQEAIESAEALATADKMPQEVAGPAAAMLPDLRAAHETARGILKTACDL